MQLDLSRPDISAALRILTEQHGLVHLGFDTRILACSQNFADTVDSRIEHIVGRRFDDLFKSAADPQMPDLYARVQRGEGVKAHLPRTRSNGRILCMDVTFAPVPGPQGQPDGMLALVEDVTEAHLRFLNTQDQLAALSRSMAVIEFTPHGDIIEANENFLKAFGYTAEEVRGRHHRMFIDTAEAATPAYAEFWRQLGAGISQSGTFCRLGRGGTPVWIEASYNAVTDADGRVARVVKYASDVTDQQLAVQALTEGIGRLAEGDLTARIERQLSGSFAQVRDSFNGAMDALCALVEEVSQRSGAIEGEAAAISQGAEDLARRGEAQAASLEQTAAAVEQISGNVTSTSESARAADASAHSAQQIVADGAGIVGRAIAAMERIDGHTRNMSEFTRVIENFAFQTNLLSINAAVEAARAGEVGRGFAVVANEVRNLAQQSAKAGQSIAGLIGKSETEVATGVKLVREAGGALEQIREAVSAMASSVAGIAHATTEQATGVREVSEALSQLDSVNQSNLAVGDRTAAAAQSLSTQVTEMTALLDRFHTGVEPVRAPAPQQTAAPLRRSA